MPRAILIHPSGHEEISLPIFPELKRLRADFDKSRLAIKRNCCSVALPHAQPNYVTAFLPSFRESGFH